MCYAKTYPALIKWSSCVLSVAHVEYRFAGGVGQKGREPGRAPRKRCSKAAKLPPSIPGKFADGHPCAVDGEKLLRP